MCIRDRLEEVASSFEGVESCYAIQAGREIRIMVRPEVVSDEKMTLLAREICKDVYKRQCLSRVEFAPTGGQGKLL